MNSQIHCTKKEFANATECPECGQSRWKNVKDRNEKRKQISSKVIWYFPPIPRFKRLFRSIKCAENLTWHASERIEDGKLRHPADSPAWKLVDFKWPDFGSEPRNLRLALSADRVNPHGPKQPEDDIGTYLAPLIEDFKLLWENGVECYDAYREEVFNLSKDGLNARHDLVDLKLRPELAPISSEKKIFIPPACYTLTKEEKQCVLKTLSRVKVPEVVSHCDKIGATETCSLCYTRPLSIGVPFKPEQELLRQAHRYVSENTIDVQPYMEKHMKALQLQYPNKSKNQKWLQEEHNRTFIHWLQEEVSTELEVGNSGVSDNLRWIAHGPHPFVITYSGYAINGCRYHTKSSEKNRSVQNSGVSLVAKTMQVSSSKDKNPVIGDMSFYGVIQEIWELNYNTFNVPVFKCDWVQNSGGVRIDELGYTLVDLNRAGHKSESFILESQAKQVFYVEDPSDVRWSVVLTPPQRDFEDRYNDDELGDTILRCEGIPNDMPDVYLNNDLDENVSMYVRSDCEGTWIPT
ncbi:transposase [Cucumis melo var. makuwa]|uniref:Transposase n=1 Tax=Cucumis melo var. makuwa TaxID=1194695 RepID=A0A5A7TZ17_CUCMM|nr:transposase [Cucumis melo var. makuwa]